MDRLRNLFKQNPRVARIVVGFLILYILKKFYQRWKHAQKIFTKPNETKSRVVLITGCDTGFGNAIALKLSIKYGYRVIATCLKQESVDNFLSNSSFTSNKSTATILDVTNQDNIDTVKQFTIKYLNKNNSHLWGIVNNAGIIIPGSFEMVPPEMDMFERNVLFLGPLNITRSLLPLLYGRKNYKTNKSKTSNNGGRIVNVASMAAHFPTDTRYGPSKASLAYFSHALRMELSPRFGIWVTSVEPAPFGTTLWVNANLWSKRIINKLKENNETELIDIYEFDEKGVEVGCDKVITDFGPKIDAVVDSVIHGLIGKYPQRVYRPGSNMQWSLIMSAPYVMQEALLRRNVINHSGSK